MHFNFPKNEKKMPVALACGEHKGMWVNCKNLYYFNNKYATVKTCYMRTVNYDHISLLSF